MIRATIFLVLVSAFAVGIAYLADHPGTVSLVWWGYRVDTSVGVLIALVALLSAAVAILYQFWRFLRRAPGSIARNRREGRRLKGYRALTQGMVAVAAGDAAEAQRQARRADVLLNEPPLTMLLSAQAAQLNGDEAAAAKYFTAMLERPETEFLGLRGLIVQASKKGDIREALDLARRARELRPKTGWVLTTLHDLQVRSGDWPAAEATARAAARAGAINGSEGSRSRAIALYQQSLAAEEAGEREAALRAVRRAVEFDPGFVPAAVRAATLLAAAGKRRRAQHIVEEAWARHPHPDLARVYLELGEDRESLSRMMRVQRLVARHPVGPESGMALAEAALAARLWGEARRALEALGVESGSAPSARVCRLWAALEEAEHGDGAVARAWLAKATTAAPDPAWICDHCGAAHGGWLPLCRRCGAYDSLVWRSAAQPPALELAVPPAVPVPAEASVAAPPRPAEAATDVGANS